MALPVLKHPTFELTVPSTKQKLTYRPFLVKEEKLLLIGMESEEEKQLAEATKQVIKNCIFGDINVDKLPVFDIEYIFVSLRAKSVGEGIKLNPTCEHCEEVNEDVKIDLDNLNFNKQNINSKYKLDNIQRVITIFSF